MILRKRRGCSSQTRWEGVGEESDSQQLARDACFVPVGMIQANSRSRQIPDEKAHFVGEAHALLTGHRLMNLSLKIPRGGAGIADGHTRDGSTRVSGKAVGCLATGNGADD